MRNLLYIAIGSGIGGGIVSIVVTLSVLNMGVESTDSDTSSNGIGGITSIINTIHGYKINTKCELLHSYFGSERIPMTQRNEKWQQAAGKIFDAKYIQENYPEEFKKLEKRQEFNEANPSYDPAQYDFSDIYIPILTNEMSINPSLKSKMHEIFDNRIPYDDWLECGYYRN